MFIIYFYTFTCFCWHRNHMQHQQIFTYIKRKNVKYGDHKGTYSFQQRNHNVPKVSPVQGHWYITNHWALRLKKWTFGVALTMGNFHSRLRTISSYTKDSAYWCWLIPGNICPATKCSFPKHHHCYFHWTKSRLNPSTHLQHRHFHVSNILP
jgi:hypothetical protein